MKAQYTLDVKPIIREWLDDVERGAKDRKNQGGLTIACTVADNVVMSCRNLRSVLDGWLESYGLGPLGLGLDLLTDADEIPF